MVIVPLLSTLPPAFSLMAAARVLLPMVLMSPALSTVTAAPVPRIAAPATLIVPVEVLSRTSPAPANVAVRPTYPVLVNVAGSTTNVPAPVSVPALVSVPRSVSVTPRSPHWLICRSTS